MEQSKSIPFWRSIQMKFALTYIVIIVSVLVLLNVYPVVLYQDLVFQSKYTALLQDQASIISSTLAGPEMLTEKSIEGALALLGGAADNRRIMVTDPAGLVLYDSSSINNATSQYALLQEVTNALSGKDVFRSSYRDGAFRSRAATPITYRGMTMGAVYIYEYDGDQGEFLMGIQHNLRNISIVVSVVSLLLSVIISSALTRRIGALLRAVRIVREGEYSHRVPVTGGDELSRLGGEFNALTRRLQTTEEVRRRFVSDASHELKTPLASIRLLTDSILQNEGMDQETAREFVTDIGDEAERLTRITEKLLTLTRMDSAIPASTEAVNLASVIKRVSHMLAPVAGSAGVALRLNLEPDCIVKATDDDMYQVFFNLMENAIKYNKLGGAVFVSLSSVGEMVHIAVEDTGVGIPEEDLSKIFDRFYRVDKARSRAAGGTGLGLSIVWDTIRQHGGTITARRRPEEGTCFDVTFFRHRERGGQNP